MRLTLLASAALLFALPALAQTPQRPPQGAPEIEPNTYAAYWRSKAIEGQSEAAQANGEAAALNKHLSEAKARIAELEKQLADAKNPPKVAAIVPLPNATTPAQIVPVPNHVGEPAPFVPLPNATEAPKAP